MCYVFYEFHGTYDIYQGVKEAATEIDANENIVKQQRLMRT